jgi:hypothetical protein
VTFSQERASKRYSYADQDYEGDKVDVIPLSGAILAKHL